MAMLILKETLVDANGAGPVFQLGGQRGKLLILTLGITSIIERDSILISVWGSVDGKDWGLTPVASFTPKYYCGFYSTQLNLAMRPEVRYLRVHWYVKRWKSNEVLSPVCGFYVSADASGARLTAVA